MAADQERKDESEPLSQSTNSERLLPMSRVRTIMKSSPDVENISQDALTAVTAATELFIKDLARKVYSSKTELASDISYTDLANLINNDEAYSFLDEIIPRKVSGRDILAARQTQNGDNSEDDDELEEKTDKMESEDTEAV